MYPGSCQRCMTSPHSSKPNKLTFTATQDGTMMCHATQMLLDDTFCRSDDPSSNASLASEKTFGKKVVGRKRNQQQHISSAHDSRLGALLWHQMVDRRSTWGKSDSFCQPADLGWPKTISPLRMTTILIVSYTQTQPSHHGVAVKTGLV